MRLVYVEWLDSYGCSATWQSIEGVSPRPLMCRSVGWLLHDDETCKVVVPHLTDSGHDDAEPQGCGDMTIPTCAILRVVDLPDSLEANAGLSQKS